MSVEAFNKSLKQAYQYQSQLDQIYKRSVQLINDLKNGSKKYLVSISDVEGGLANSQTDSEKSFDDTVHKLAEDIEAFNNKIGEDSNEFAEVLTMMLGSVEECFEFYAFEHGQLNQLLTLKKTLIYLEMRVRKFKNKINSLQLMNNMLFAFTAELKEVKMAYRSNLINVNTLMTHAIESCQSSVKQINTLT